MFSKFLLLVDYMVPTVTSVGGNDASDVRNTTF